MDELRILKPDLSESTYHWAIGAMVRDGTLTRLGYGSYSLSSDLPKDEYVPSYSDTAERLIRLISEKYPYVQFTVFETVFPILMILSSGPVYLIMRSPEWTVFSNIGKSSAFRESQFFSIPRPQL